VKDYCIGDDVYHVRQDFYGLITDVFYIEDIIKSKKHTVKPIYVVLIYEGIGRGTRVAVFHDLLCRTGEMN